MKNHLKKLKTIVLIFSIFIFTGCARTVTEIKEPLRIKIDIFTKNTPDIRKTNIYIIGSLREFPEIALPEKKINFNPYFPTPGRTFDSNQFNDLNLEDYQTNGITPYYENYFQTWSHYIVINNKEAFMYNPETQGFDKSTIDNFSYSHSREFRSLVSYTEKVISIEFNISDVFSTLPEDYFFSIVTSHREDDSETGFFQDKIDAIQQIKLKSFESNESVENSSEIDIVDSANIIKWRAELF